MHRSEHAQTFFYGPVRGREREEGEGERKSAPNSDSQENERNQIINQM